MPRIERRSLLLYYKKTANAFCMFQPKDGKLLPMFRVPCQSYFLHNCILFLYSATVDKAGKLHPSNKIHTHLPTYQPVASMSETQMLQSNICLRGHRGGKRKEKDIIPSKSSTAKHSKKGLNFLCSNHMLSYFLCMVIC